MSGSLRCTSDLAFPTVFAACQFAFLCVCCDSVSGSFYCYIAGIKCLLFWFHSYLPGYLLPSFPTQPSPSGIAYNTFLTAVMLNKLSLNSLVGCIAWLYLTVSAPISSFYLEKHFVKRWQSLFFSRHFTYLLAVQLFWLHKDFLQILSLLSMDGMCVSSWSKYWKGL